VKISVHMLVRNGDMVVGRALHSLRGLVDEVVFIDAGSTDRTSKAIRSVCDEMGIPSCGVTLDQSDDRWFFTDEPSTWRRRAPGPFSLERTLRRFDEARNLGLELCSGDYVFKLDADDEVTNTEGFSMLVPYLDSNKTIDYVMCPYEIMKGSTVHEVVQYVRLWRRNPGVRFVQAIHEYLPGLGSKDGKVNWTMIASGLRVRDWRDNPGIGSRVPNRNYKVFLLEYERRQEAGEDLDSRFLLSSIDDVEQVDAALAAELRALAGKVG
jgi:glycosyltransferase involved in cell wall biosynthesis